MTNSAAKATAWKWFSKYIRKRAADDQDLIKCFTCGKYCHYKNSDAGHFQSRRYESTKFDENNVHPQCKHCNMYLAGNIGVYYEQIEKTYGTGTAKKIIQKSQMTCKRNYNDLKTISDKYRQLYNKL